MPNLYYVIGASGAGKDSLLNYCRTQMPDNSDVLFAHRYITRAANAGGENHIALSRNEFINRQQHNLFIMHWFSHQCYYGIGWEVEYWLKKGLNVIVNGSRAYMKQAIEVFPELIPILVSVDPDILKDRLIKRGRENEQQIQQRLIQAETLQKNLTHPALVNIVNNETLEKAGDQLMNVILR